jgi:hypothetical protein
LDPSILGSFKLDASSIAAAFLFGVIGMWLFKEGRRREHSISIYIAIALMIYPYFVEKASYSWIIGSGLCYAAYYYWWR